MSVQNYVSPRNVRLNNVNSTKVTDMSAPAISNQQESFMVQGDISVLADLLVAHRDQLKRLHSNNRSLVEFYNKFAAAKAVSDNTFDTTII